MELLAEMFAVCRAAVVSNGGVIGTLAVAGLVGSFVHCGGMCGPFVLAQTTTRLAEIPASNTGGLTRLSGALLAPYHGGRIATYAGLGAVAGLVTGTLRELPGFPWLSAALLAFAAVFFLGYGLARLGVPWLSLPAGGASPRRPAALARKRGESGFGRAGGGGSARRLGRLAGPLFDRPLGWRGIALGMALGFLPCGLLYGAIAAAAAGGSALTGALAMAAFGLGTVPALVGVGLVGHFAVRRWRRPTNLVGAFLMLVNAGVLGWLAWRAAA